MSRTVGTAHSCSFPAGVNKNVVVERLPARLAAALLEHNHKHVPEANMRLRMAVHAGEVYHDDYGVVGEAVNLTYRLLDAAGLKDALANSGAVVALITSDWFFREVVRHCRDCDPTSFRQIRVVRKETDTIAWIHVPEEVDAGVVSGSHPPPGPAPGVPEHAARRLWEVSKSSARRLGARRTAYPLDLSIAELHERGVYVPATFTDLTGEKRSVDVDVLATKIKAHSSILILGEPGSGKSVAAYALLEHLRRHTPAIAARMSELRTAVEPAEPKTPLVAALRRADVEPGLRPVLVVDGLDETISGFGAGGDLSELLTQLGERFTMVVTCRRREFEDQLALFVDSSIFDSIYEIDTWTLEGQFTEFVGRLRASGLLESDRLIGIVKASADLAGIAVRPLYARMLTFLGQDGLDTVNDVSSLYAEYIDKLALASDVALAHAGCQIDTRSREVWIEAAWQIFSQGTLIEDRFDFDAVTEFFEGRFADDIRCLARALSQICDQWRAGGRAWGRFVHYSFFEYLVSRHYVRKLREAVTAGPEVIMASLSFDPSPEIRHFVVDELREAKTPGLSRALEEAYRRLRVSASRSARTRTAGNLVAYLLSRAAQDGRVSLWRLLDGEDDMFLQQSLLWGLCHLGDSEALVRFVREARSSAQWRAWNRGYVMYYYGDIDRRAEPPYVDSDPTRGWGRTRERSISLMSAHGYRQIVPPQRRYLDLYLLYDCAIWRWEGLSGDDARVARRTLDELWLEQGIESALLHELQAMHAVVCQRPG